MSDTVWSNGLQHARLPFPSVSPGACSNSCPLSWWCYPTISSSVSPFSSCPQSFPASGSFLMSQLFASSGQSIGASASVLPRNIQGWFSLGLTGLIFLLSKRLSRVFSSTTVWKHQFFSAQLALWSNSHIHTWLLENPYLWLYGPLLSKRLTVQKRQFVSTLFLYSQTITSIHDYWKTHSFDWMDLCLKSNVSAF